MGKIKLKAGLKGLKNNEVYEKLVDEFESTFKEMNEIYDLIVDYPFAADIKERLLLLNQKFKTLKELLKELKQEKEQLILFKDRLRKRLNEMSEKVRKIASLVSLHQFIFEKNDELEKRAEELKKTLEKYQTTDISELENELLAHDVELSDEEKKVEMINKELNIIAELFNKEFEKLTEQINKEENEIESLKKYVKEHDEEIKTLIEKYSMLELLKSDIKELIESKEKKNKKKEQKEVMNSRANKKELSKKYFQSNKKKKQNKKKSKKINPKLKKLLQLKEKYENIINNSISNDMKQLYLERLNRIIEQINSLEEN